MKNDENEDIKNLREALNKAEEDFKKKVTALKEQYIDEDTKLLAEVQNWADGIVTEEIKKSVRETTEPRQSEHSDNHSSSTPNNLNVDDLVSQKINELDKTLNERFKKLEQQVPKKAHKKKFYASNPEKVKHHKDEETRKWIEYSKPLTKTLEKRLKDRYVFGDAFKFQPTRKLAAKLHSIDNKIASALTQIAEMELVITRDNIVSKVARRLLGVRLPYEPDYIETEEGKKSKWVAIFEKMKKDPSYREADPERVVNNIKC